MKRYQVTAVIDASINLGEYVAESVEEVERMVWGEHMNGDGVLPFCHRCSSKAEFVKLTDLIVKEV